MDSDSTVLDLDSDSTDAGLVTCLVRTEEPVEYSSMQSLLTDTHFIALANFKIDFL